MSRFSFYREIVYRSFCHAHHQLLISFRLLYIRWFEYFQVVCHGNFSHSKCDVNVCCHAEYFLWCCALAQLSHIKLLDGNLFGYSLSSICLIYQCFFDIFHRFSRVLNIMSRNTCCSLCFSLHDCHAMNLI